MALLAAAITSVIVARSIGPALLAHFSFLNWMTLTGGKLASLGLPLATRKYMAEYLGRDEGGIVRAIYSSALRKQALLAGITTLAGIFLVFTVYERSLRLMAVVLMLSLVPQMIGYIPSLANDAAEHVQPNVRGSLAGTAVFVIGVVLSLAFGWSVVGVAFSNLVSQLVEMTVKLVSVRYWITSLPRQPLPELLRDRMRDFSRGSLALTVLNIVVWNRSDILFLRLLSGDIRQIAFFSLPFSLVEKVLLLPQALTNAVALTLLAERGRNTERMVRIAESSLKLTLLCGLPLLIGLAALSGPLINTVYGPLYAPAAPVLAVVAILAISKAIFGLVQTLYLATENVPFLLRVTACGAVLNMSLDVVLIPFLGALGAAIANGLSQTIAAAWLCRRAIPRFGLRVDWRSMGKILASATTMGILVLLSTWSLRPSVSLFVGCVVGAAVFLALSQAFAVVSRAERLRFWHAAAGALGWPGRTSTA